MHHLSSKPFLLFILPVLSYFGATLLLAPHITHAAGNTYYVRQGGDDSHSCSQAQTDSDASAKGTIQDVLTCPEFDTSGNTVIVHGGTYNESGAGDGGAVRIYSSSRGNSWDDANTLKAADGETVWIVDGLNVSDQITSRDGGGYRENRYWIIERINVDGNFAGGATVVGDSTHHIRYKNMEIKNNRFGVHGVGDYSELINLHVHDMRIPGDSECLYQSGGQAGCYGTYLGASHVLVDGGMWHDINNYAIHIYNGANTNTDVTVRNTRIWNAQTGIGAFNRDHHIYNNIVYNNSGIGIFPGNNAEVYNNTVYGNAGGGIVDANSNVSGATIRNNIAFNNSGDQIGVPGSNTLSHNLTSDPGFVSSSDFHLSPNSPAVNAGMTLPEVPCDFDGNARPAGSAYDIGAYEQGGTPGSGCSKGGGATPTPTSPATPTPIPPPVVTIVAIPQNLSTAGQGTTLQWSVTNATSCTASGGWSGTQATGGATRFTPTATTIYTLTCTGPGGEGQGSATVTVGQSSLCTKYASGSSIPSGFGVPWDVQNPNILLLNATCTSPTVLLKVGNQQASNVLYIYKTAYTAPAGASGWTPVDLFGSSLISGAWYRSFAQGVATMDTSTPSYYVGYACSWTGTAWKCGCRDVACSQSYWQIQRIQQ